MSAFLSKYSKLLFITIFLFTFGYLFHLTFRNLEKQPISDYISLSIPPILYYLILIIFIFFIIKFIEKNSFSNYGLKTQNIFREMLLGVILSLILFIPLRILSYIILNDKFSFDKISSNNIVDILIWCIFFLFFLAFTEELLFRGYLFEKIYQKTNSKLYAILASSVIFALWHYPTNPSILNLYQIIQALIIGLILSLVKLKLTDKSIISLIIAHGLFNLYVFLT